MSTQLTPEQRKQRTETILKLAGVGVIALVVGPFAMTILSGLGALLAIGLATAVSYVALKMSGWFALKVSNWRLKALKAEATKNPVETLQTEYAKKEQALAQFKENIRIFMGQVSSFADQVTQYVKDGLEDADVYKQQLAKMKQLLELRKQKYSDAEDALAAFADAIQRTDRKWKMACAAAAMNEAAGQMEGDVFDKICIETALDSVQQKLNQSFADLDLALLDDNKAKKAASKKAELAAPQTVADLDAAPSGTNTRQRIAVS